MGENGWMLLNKRTCLALPIIWSALFVWTSTVHAEQGQGTVITHSGEGEDKSDEGQGNIPGPEGQTKVDTADSAKSDLEMASDSDSETPEMKITEGEETGVDTDTPESPPQKETLSQVKETEEEGTQQEDKEDKNQEKPEKGFPLLSLADEMFLGTVALTGWGVTHWYWFTEGFLDFKSENGFSADSGTGGSDKTAHFFDSYVIADFMAWRLREYGYDDNESALYGAIASMILMTWIEIGDSTGRYGFSLEDLTADFLGVTVSWTLNTLPVVSELIGFKLYYWPTAKYFKSGNVVADYSGMKYFIALKLSGIPYIKDTPLRFLEGHFGYYTRGFRSFDENKEDARRVLYVGIGLNFNAILRPILPTAVKTILNYYQPPFTSLDIYKKKYINKN